MHPFNLVAGRRSCTGGMFQRFVPRPASQATECENNQVLRRLQHTFGTWGQQQYDTVTACESSVQGWLDLYNKEDGWHCSLCDKSSKNTCTCKSSRLHRNLYITKGLLVNTFCTNNHEPTDHRQFVLDTFKNQQPSSGPGCKVPPCPIDPQKLKDCVGTVEELAQRCKAKGASL